MMIKVFGFAVAWLMASGVLSAKAQAPVDYFNAGEVVRFVNTFNYLVAYTPADLKTKLDSNRDLLVKAGATDKVLASYDAMEKVYLTLPFQQSYANWTQPQKDLWNNTTFNDSAVGDWLGATDTKPRFFYYFGYDALYFGKSGPSSVGEWGYSLSSAQTYYKAALKDFAWMRDSPDLLATLLPPLQAAIKTIAQYYEKAIDPMGNGLSMADVTAMQQATSPIFDAASNGKLTQ
jgi:hypothetical protein